MRITPSIINLALCAGLLTTAVVTTTSGCASARNGRTTGQYIDDTTLKMHVKDALSDNQEYKFNGVNVDVFRGTVQLNGFVNTSDQKGEAEKIAKQVQGVQNVVNNLTVKSQQ
jgi:hyperosmotically inducible protein